MRSSASPLFAAALLACATAAEPLPKHQSLVDRATFYGGWALVADTCPDGTAACGKRTCCPNGTNCVQAGAGWSNRCCPGENDCYSAVMQVPICANTDWTLWGTKREPMCCLPGQQGTQPVESYFGNCLPGDVNVPDAQKATLLAAGNGAAPTSPTTGKTNSPSSTGTPPKGQQSDGSNPSQQNGSNKPALSTAAIAGIAAGAVAIILIVSVIFWLCLRRNKKWYEKQLKEAQMMAPQPHVPVPVSYAAVSPGVGGGGMHDAKAPYSSSGMASPAPEYQQQRYEQSRQDAQEVDGGQGRISEYRYELPPGTR